MSKFKQLYEIIEELNNIATSIQELSTNLTEMFSSELSTPTFEDLRASLTKYASVNGKEDVKALLAKYNATKLSEVSKEHYNDILKEVSCHL